MKRYRTISRFNKYHCYLLLLIVALIVSLYICISSIQTSITEQMNKYLYIQMQQAILKTLAGEETKAFVHLRRDNNDNITSVTVNGILLSQLQMRYHEALITGSQKYNISLTPADILGSRLFSILPGNITIPYSSNIIWESSIISRTLENSGKSRQFQLVLVTMGTSNRNTLFNVKLEEEVVLYETIIYADNP